MAIYVWEGPEKSLGGLPIMATRMSIESVTDRTDDAKYAEGSFEFIDYVENARGNDPWEAFGNVGQDGKVVWSVHRKNDGQFCWQSENGELIFTLIAAVNDDIKKFVADKLEEVMAKIAKGESTLIDTTCGACLEVLLYEGPCLCDWFSLAHASVSEVLVPVKPTPLQAVTGEQYLENCFVCSCGTKWWSYGIGAWAKVADPAAWQMLITHGGKEIQSLGFFEGAFYLLQTLRNRGYIPLG